MLPVVDAHHHLWDLQQFPYRWLDAHAPPRPFGDHTPIKRDYLPSHYLSDMGALDLLGAVQVEADSGSPDPCGEIRWLEAQSATLGIPTAIVARADLTSPTIEAALDAMVEFPSVRGVRTNVVWHTEPRWRQARGPGIASTAAFARGMSALAERGLSLDILISSQQLPDVDRLAETAPDTRIVLNHIGNPYFADSDAEGAWFAGIGSLARRPNVVMKFTGLWTLDMGWAEEALSKPVRHVVDCFGAERCMWGSNYPVEKIMVPIATQIRTLSNILGSYPARDRRSVFAETAQRVYRLADGGR